MLKLASAVVFAAALLVFDCVFCCANEALLKTLADKMEERITYLDGIATYREFDVNETTETFSVPIRTRLSAT